MVSVEALKSHLSLVDIISVSEYSTCIFCQYIYLISIFIKILILFKFQLSFISVNILSAHY